MADAKADSQFLVMLEVCLKHLLWCLFCKGCSAAEHSLAEGPHVRNLSERQEILNRRIVFEGSGRTLEHDGVTDNPTEQHPCKVGRDLHIVSQKQLVNDGAGRSQRLAADEDGISGLGGAEAVMVDDLNHLSLIDARHSLLILIMVHHDQLGLGFFQKTTPGDVAQIGIPIKDGETPELAVGKNVPCLIKEAVSLQAGWVLYHELFHRDAQTQETQRFSCIQSTEKDSSLIGVPIDIAGDFLFNSCKNDGRNLQFDSFTDMVFPVTDHQYWGLSFQRFHVLAEDRVAHGPYHDRSIEAWHLPFSQERAFQDFGEIIHHKVVDRTLSAVLLEDEAAHLVDTQQTTVLIPLHDGDDRTAACGSVERNERVDRIGYLDSALGISAYCRDLGPHILDERGWNYVQSLKLGFGCIVEVTASDRQVGIARIQFVFQKCITIGSTDAVHIRVPMPAYIYLCHFKLLSMRHFTPVAKSLQLKRS
ncbi:hypothetical protein SDC9_95053 [bioreactor metagenome]|uniref:Uncharacterized protein n=1 Tax=bioreactor metagenome TaxID=1076179 RepID=A0A645A565_9ZZZZ